MNIVAVCRGAPGLGRVTPSLALVQALSARGPVTIQFLSYGAGARYLAARGETVTDLGEPDGLFIDAVAPQALRVLEIIEQHAPDLVLVDGEFYLPATLAHLGLPVVYLANPHDLSGPPTTFRRVNRLLLAHASGVLVSSLTCPEPRPRPDLVPNRRCLEVPALAKDISLRHNATGAPPRILISTGGGSLRSPALRAATSTALTRVLGAVAPLTEVGQIDSVSVVLGADATLPQRWHACDWLHVINRPIELADLYPHHDVLIARAGRNTIAEAAYCGIPTALLPITADSHRADEQAHNAAAAAQYPCILPLANWHDPAALRQTLTEALLLAHHGIRPIGHRGNESAATFVTQLADEAHHPAITGT